MAFRRLFSIILAGLAVLSPAYAAQVAIVIDDFGYRPKTENQILKLPIAISVAVLPDSPQAKEMAEKAHRQGREVLIHLPMAPISKQRLERNTLFPSMDQAQIDSIIQQAIINVPYAKGINNHMGSLMTGDLAAMKRVMHSLNGTHYYFLDSVTIGKTKAGQAAREAGIPSLHRNIFLDDTQSEQNVRQQLNNTIALARKHGSAIAIGHPHPVTVKVLQQMVPELPADIELVAVSALLLPLPETSSGANQPTLPRLPQDWAICQAEHTAERVHQIIARYLVSHNFKSLFEPAPLDEEVSD